MTSGPPTPKMNKLDILNEWSEKILWGLHGKIYRVRLPDKLFFVSESTMLKGGKQSKLVKLMKEMDNSKNGQIFIEIDSTVFKVALNYMRHGKYIGIENIDVDILNNFITGYRLKIPKVSKYYYYVKKYNINKLSIIIGMLAILFVIKNIF